MAYLITHDDNTTYKIAANDTDKNCLNCLYPPNKSFDISDSDFTKLKSGMASASVSGESVTITDLGDGRIETQADLNSIIESKRLFCKSFLDNSKTTNGMYTRVQNYHDYLASFDTSTVTFPLAKNWEKYCEDNSITYLNTLQIP